MDNLANKLREDAARIDADVSPELEARIQASLHNVTPEAGRRQREISRPPIFWLASSLTGVAAALAVIAILNVGREVPPPQPPIEATAQHIELPDLDLNVEAAMLTGPLSEELANLQADLKKAEEVVRQDVRIDF